MSQDDLANDTLKFIINATHQGQKITLDSQDPESNPATREQITRSAKAHLADFISKRDAHARELETTMRSVIEQFPVDKITNVEARVAASSGWRKKDDCGEATPAHYIIKNHGNASLLLTDNHFSSMDIEGFEQGKVAHVQFGRSEIYLQIQVMNSVNPQLKAEFDKHISELLQLAKDRTAPKT